MAAPDWQIQNVPTPPVGHADTINDQLAEAIDEQAMAFPSPPLFRAAVYRILAASENLNVDQIAADLAWQRMEKIFAAIEHFNDPEITLDAIRCLGHLNNEQGVFIADLARKHKISRQCMYKRILRVGTFLGVEYERKKPHRAADDGSLPPG
jgi:hypothetical protein